MRLAGVDSACDIASATRLLVGLPVFLRRRAVAQEAHAVIRRRLEQRSATFLEKLNAGGMTFLDTDIVRLLERDLPARFGGGPTDFQLVEQEREDGRPRVVLIVHPGVGAVDPAAVAEYLLDRLGRGSGAERIMALTWRQSDILEVERGVPKMTAAGKLLPVLKVTGQLPRPS